MALKEISGEGRQVTRFGLINLYLVREADGWTLVDTGVGGSERAVLEAAGTAPVRRILLTHAHGDHVGSVDGLVKRLPGVEVLISARDERLLRKKPAQDRSTDPGEPTGKLKGSYPGTVTRPTRLLVDGDRVGSLVALATPGHTPGHMSFFDERDGTLYAGDGLVCVGGNVHVPGFGPWYFPLPALATWDKGLAVRSVESLLQRVGSRVKAIGAGHGRLIRGGAERLEQALAEARRKGTK